MQNGNNNEEMAGSEMNPVAPFLHDADGSSLKALNRIAKRPSVEIQFQDLSYTVPDKNCEDGMREILSSVSGTFRPGELTGILGPSGAGKSTLMNILTGYTGANVKGNILVNGYPRDMRTYHKISSYIMQDDLVQPYLTVQEAMEVAANLKLGKHLGKQEKLLVIEEVLETLGLTSCKDTPSDNLSGGQRKRLSVALELVNNPPIIFLDEPTSGLDVVSTKQCVTLLKLLVNQGRTIICTIHQPAASILSLFDNLYIIAKGKCVYHGSPSNLVPFLEKSGFNCPTTHNPADFILETVQADNSNITSMLTLIANGRNCEGLTELNHKKSDIVKNFGTEIKNGLKFPTSFWTQFYIILKRIIMQKMRNRTALWIQFIHHLFSSMFLGGIFYGVGNDGDKPLTNFKFCLTIVVFFTYTYAMVPILIYPSDVKYLKREYFNRWYGLNAYFAALMVSGIPLMLLLGMLAITITYLMSSQLLEFDRFIFFSIMSITTGLCAEAFGYAIASLFNTQNGSIIAPSLMIPLLSISIYGMGFGSKITTSMTVAMRSSYLRYSMAGLTTTIFADRPRMFCSEIYCHYADTNILIRDLGLAESKYGIELFGLLGFILFYRLLSYIFLRRRLQPDTIFNLETKIKLK